MPFGFGLTAGLSKGTLHQQFSGETPTTRKMPKEILNTKPILRACHLKSTTKHNNMIVQNISLPEERETAGSGGLMLFIHPAPDGILSLDYSRTLTSGVEDLVAVPVAAVARNHQTLHGPNSHA